MKLRQNIVRAAVVAGLVVAFGACKEKTEAPAENKEMAPNSVTTPPAEAPAAPAEGAAAGH